jgi:hypothetical protein
MPSLLDEKRWRYRAATGRMGGADFGGGVIEWQTLQCLSKIALPSTAAQVLDGKHPLTTPEKTISDPVARIFCTCFMAHTCSWVHKISNVLIHRSVEVSQKKEKPLTQQQPVIVLSLFFQET